VGYSSVRRRGAAVAQSRPVAKTPQIAIPPFARRQSGLLVPIAVADLGVAPGEAVDVPGDLRPKPQPVAIATHTPTVADQMAVYLDEPSLGLSVSSVEDLRRRLSAVGFEPAMLLASLINAKVFALRGDIEGQLRMARELLADGPYRSAARFAARHDNPQIFAEQNCFILQRLLVEAARDSAIEEDRSDAENEAIVLALFGASSVAGLVEECARAEARGESDWLAFFIQNGAYNSVRMPLGEVVRAQELFERLAQRSDLQDPRLPIDQWMVDDYGFSVGEQMTLGFAVAAMTRILDDDPGADYKLYVRPEHFDDLLLKLGWLDRRREALELLSATRTEFEEEFAAAGAGPPHVAWEIRPFMRHPFLRCQNDGLVALSPRGICSWLSDGFHYRLLDSAQRRAGTDGGRTSNNYTALAGKLLEAYCIEIAESVHPGQRPVGSGRVYGEQPYGRGGGRQTSDVAIDLGQDLVLVEVSVSRLRADTLILGQNEQVEADLERMIVNKVKQLDGCISALIAGEAAIPDVDLDRVLRIWPVLVSAGEVTQTPLLWDFIRHQAPACLKQPKVQPLTLLDLEDYEQLIALVERGRALHELLGKKTAPEYRDLELAMWLSHDPSAPAIERPPQMVDEAYARLADRAMDQIDFAQGVLERSE
jgi:hypothetical protein